MSSQDAQGGAGGGRLPRVGCLLREVFVQSVFTTHPPGQTPYHRRPLECKLVVKRFHFISDFNGKDI